MLRVASCKPLHFSQKYLFANNRYGEAIEKTVQDVKLVGFCQPFLLEKALQTLL